MELPTIKEVLGLDEQQVEKVIQDFLDHRRAGGHEFEGESDSFILEQYFATFGGE